MHRAALGFVLAIACAGCVIDELREDEVGDAPACEAARRWPRDYAEDEDALMLAVNAARRRGAMCGDATLNPAPDLVVAPELRCAARVHSTDLSERGELSHEGSDGSSTLVRVRRSGYPGIPRAELLANDYDDASDVVAAWLDDPGHCEALLDPLVVEAGPGHARTFDGSQAGWVLVTGEERE